MHMKNIKIIECAYLCILLPVVLNFFMYYGFITNYTRGVFSINSFSNQYDNSIYRYRILGKFLLLKIYELMPYSNPGKIMTSLDENFSQSLYNSYFILNTLFFCGTMIFIYFIFSSINNTISSKERKLTVVICGFLIAITQYVVVPYDSLSYFFLVVAIYIILLRTKSIWNTMILSVVVFLATITRESAALILSFYATIYLLRNGISIKKDLLHLLLVISVFLITYIGLRVEYGIVNSIYNNLTIGDFLKIQNIISLVFFIVFILIFNTNINKFKNSFLFLFLSAPYIVAIFLTGILFESRLWIPLLIPMIVLASSDKSRYLSEC